MDNNRISPGKSAFGPKQIILAFIVVLVAYMGIYHWIEHRRNFKGPWELYFSVDTQGKPTLAIRQPGLGLDKQIQFEGESISITNLPASVVIDKPGRDTPFGHIIYEDLTFLPGVVTFNLFGHEVELLPRVLLINKKEVAWDSPKLLVVNSDEKPSTPPVAPKGGTRDVTP